MPIDSTHQRYDEYAPWWRRVRDAWAGSDAVKEAGDAYLPKLGGQDADEYDAYKTRAFWHSAVARTIEGFVGLAFRIDPQVEIPDRWEPWLENITLTDQDFFEFARAGFAEVVALGRYGILVEQPATESTDNRPYLCDYKAEDIRNWREIREGGVTKLIQVVLFETVSAPANDGFGEVAIPQYRELKINGEGLYQQQLYREEERDGKKEWRPFGEPILPTRNGVFLTEIPFVFLLDVEPTKPPMLDLADANYDHYRLMADYRHGLHYTGLPTAWVAGFPETTTLRIGSQTAWISENPSARAGFLEFTGQGLGSLVTAIDKAERTMAMLGAALLEEQPTQAETFQAVRLRQEGKQSVLGSLSHTYAKGLEKALWWMLWWGGEEEPEVAVSLNVKPLSSLDAQQITALLQARQAGEISQQTWLQTLEIGELLHGRTWEEERDAIDIEPPGPRPTAPDIEDEL